MYMLCYITYIAYIYSLYYVYIYIYIYLYRIRMNGKNIIFDDKRINNSNFCKHTKLFNIYDVELDKILLSEKEPYIRQIILGNLA